MEGMRSCMALVGRNKAETKKEACGGGLDSGVKEEGEGGQSVAAADGESSTRSNVAGRSHIDARPAGV